MSFREHCNKPESDSSDDNCEVLGEFIDPTLFNINSDDDTESSHRWTRTHLTFLDDEALYADDQTDRESLLATDNEDLNLFLDESDDLDDSEYKIPNSDVSYIFITFTLFRMHCLQVVLHVFSASVFC